MTQMKPPPGNPGRFKEPHGTEFDSNVDSASNPERNPDPGEAQQSDPKASLAWEITRNEVTIPPVRSFIARYPDAPEAKLAAEYIPQLELWEAIPQGNPFAVREFLETGPYRALGEHARRQLDDAKSKYVDEKVKLVARRMRSAREPHGILQGVAFLAFGLLYVYILLASLALVPAAAKGIITHKAWPFPQAASHIADWWTRQLQGGAGAFLARMNVDLTNLPPAETVGMGVLWCGVSILLFAIVGLVVMTIVRWVTGNLLPLQEAQIEDIRAYHLAKVRDL